MANQQSQEITQAWNKLAFALGDDLRTIQSEVQQGISQLYSFNHGEFFAVLREEIASNGKELVIVAAAGKNSMPCINEIHRKAKANGFYSIRLHTLRPKPMLKMGAHLGFKPAETILRAVL
ncbi:hypothetical protein [Shewanella maritima]|uniref:hypothetical protein n=1 Tax=Shewanella maritima TaxID=2520507 RepID=UPI00373704F6